MNLHGKITVNTASMLAVTFLTGGVLNAHAATYDSTGTVTDSRDTASDSKERVNDALHTVEHLKQDKQLASVLARAKGVFVIPHYGKGALIVGGQGGGGVVLARRNGEWTNPAFFSLDGGSIGLQAGGEGGSIVYLLMTDKAVNKFANSQNTWSLNANAGLTIVTWSEKGQANTGNGDVILWTDTNGLYGGLTASVTDITPDRDMDRAYYGHQVTSQQILSGNANLSAPDAAPLRNALAMRMASR